MQLGARKARYFGRTKTLFQLLMAATCANLTLMAMRTGLSCGIATTPRRSTAYMSAPCSQCRSGSSLVCEFVSQSQALEPRSVPTFSATLLELGLGEPLKTL